MKKSEPTEPWEIENDENIGDLELARQIREICNSVADSAEAVSVLYYGPPSETKKREIDRYERAKKRAEKKIEQISDELLRDTAIYQVLNFYMKANRRRERRKAFSSNSKRKDNRACKKRASNVSGFINSFSDWTKLKYAMWERERFPSQRSAS